MAATTHKGSKTKTAKQRRPSAKTSVAGQTQTIAELRQRLAELSQRERTTATENTRLVQELKQALEQQTATSEILRVIASSPTDNRPVLDGVAENAARLCDANDAVILRLEGDRLEGVAHHGPVPAPGFGLPTGLGHLGQPITRGWPVGRAVVDRETVHVHDLAAAIETEFPDSKVLQERIGTRTALATPLLREGIPIGGIFIRRTEVRPFTEKQIALLKTFADQAVIAIENGRLFQELKEALEQQTATSEILGVIASSPTDLQPVLNTIAENAARVCGSYDAVIRLVAGNVLRMAAHYGPTESGFGLEQPLIRGTIGGRAVIDRQTIHSHDLLAEPESEFPQSRIRAERLGNRTYLATPLLRESAPIGVILIRRKEVQPFSEKQVALLKTFADQAVIAIENVRLFRELQERNRDLTEALEQQTATGEVLRVIASSPTELQPVLDTLLANAVKLSGATIGHIRQIDGEFYRVVAHYGESVERVNVLRANPLPTNPDIPMGRALGARKPVHVLDVQSEPEPVASLVRQTGARTLLVAPLLREGTPIGGITIWRDFVEPFTERQIELVKTFADQAVIAIENVRLFQELKESLEQQTATSEILGVIASSPTDIQPVLDVVAENAARVCGAKDAIIFRIEDDLLQLAASYGTAPLSTIVRERGLPLSRGTVSGRAVVDREAIHVHDVAAELETEFPESKPYQQQGGFRTVLATPLLREGVPIGVIHIRRMEVRPFTDKQIALLKTFAAQAVIAIENVRLFKEIQERNAELREALEHQTATAEVLGIISRSPTDVQPVLDAIVESAARVCGIDDVALRLREEDAMVTCAHFGSIPIVRREISMGEQHRWMREHGALHIPDIRAQDDFPDVGSGGDLRTILLVPLRQQGELVGGLNARRTEVRPFTPAQIKLLETFADQAVIAIENVRLFNELKESLEQQTATSEILGVIASSPTDIQPVLDVVAQNAARVCGAKDAIIHRVDGNILRRVAHYGPILWLGGEETTPISRGYASGRAVVDRQTIHIHDMSEESETEFPEGVMFQRRAGHRTLLATPLLREKNPIGTILIRREQVQPFTDKQIALLKTFADQAVIAIENVRLFKELQERNAELRGALEHQTATSEVLNIISRSPTDVQPVLDAIVKSAARVCGIDDVVLRLHEGNSLVARAHFGPIPVGPVRSVDEPQVRWIREHGTLHIPDVLAQNDFPAVGSASGLRTFLFVPLRQHGEFVGILNARRTEVRPFTPAQIKLLETFADQAVIAIENVRLFNELKESLEQQTATSEILGVIASSPTDIQPVLDTVAETAARLCEAVDAVILRANGNYLQRVAQYGSIPTFPASDSPLLISRGWPAGRAVIDRQTIHVSDVLAQLETEFPDARPLQKAQGTRTVLVAPLLREEIAVGAIVIRRQEVRPFTDKQIALLTTFADQSVIAIENVRLFNELKESLEQQTATSEILGVIASSPTDIQPVLGAVAESAARLCNAKDAVIRLVEGNVLRLAFHQGPIPFLGPSEIPINRGSVTGRAVVEGQAVHVEDLLSVAATEFPEILQAGVGREGDRTQLAVPLMREGVAIGAILIRRKEVDPFTEKQIALVKTFADQAVIAIENVRLFNELEQRNRDLTEALEQQTAMSEVLGVMSSSPTDLHPVFETILANAIRLCDAHNGGLFRFDRDVLRMVAAHNVTPDVKTYFEQNPLRPGKGSAVRRAALDRRPVHIPDILTDPEFEMSEGYQREGMRTVLGVPLLKENTLIGAIGIHRREVRPFTEAHIKLVSTFANQAVIAIENVRLFQELKESLEQQTATSEILGVIASSPTDVQPVLNVVAENAAKLCDANDAVISRFDNELFLRTMASYGPIPVPREIVQTSPLTRGTPAGRAFHDRKTIHVHDLAAELETEFTDSKSRQHFSGTRTILATPLLREGNAIGTMVIRRTEVRPFTEKQIKLLETFADQAVIAIENVRLFKELQERNRDLMEALEQQTATGEILRVIASSPTDVQPVLNVVAQNAARLCDSHDAQIHRVEGDMVRKVASYGDISPVFAVGEARPISRDRGLFVDRAILGGQTIHIHDTSVETGEEYADLKRAVLRLGLRTVLAVPLLREGVPIGAILIRRTEVRPFTDKQIALLKTFADQAVIAIENVRLFQELEARTGELARSVGELKALGEVGQTVSSTLNLETVLSTIVGHAVQLSGTSGGVIYEYDEAAAGFLLRASYRMEESVVEALRAAPVRLGEGATGRSAMNRAPVQVPDTLDEREYTGTRLRPMLARLGYRSVLAVPLLREERILGALTVWRKEAGDFSPAIVNLLQTFATQSALAIQNARLFHEIEDKSRQIEAANRHKSEFLANMSHELRTPLTAVIGFSEVLSQKVFGELNDKQNEYMDDIISSGRHLLSLINDILDLSKVEAGRMELDLTKFDLSNAIDNALILMRERAARHGITLRHKVDERLGEVLGDERKFKQILLNLLSNAVKFTPEGGRIDVDARLSNESVEISVSDTGIGIAPENQETIFEEFRQVGADASKKREGTGLGLTLTKKFVELHGGSIRVESAVGRGSTFTFTLPLKQENFNGARINTDR